MTGMRAPLARAVPLHHPAFAVVVDGPAGPQLAGTFSVALAPRAAPTAVASVAA